MPNLTAVFEDDDEFRNKWNNTPAAEEFKEPIPSGEYTCEVESANESESRVKRTPSVKIVFRVTEGKHSNDRLYLDCWLTPAAIPTSKRDLAKIGVRDPEDIGRPLRKRYICKVKVALRENEDGRQFNEVRHFEVIEEAELERDAFAPRRDDRRRSSRRSDSNSRRPRRERDDD